MKDSDVILFEWLIDQSAASEGHLDVVRWLHDNRTEGCTAGAMDRAEKSGHLDVVKWLHENTSKGCTDTAMYGATGNGFVDVLRWLVEHYPAVCRADLVEIAGWEGHLDAVRYLDENTYQRASSWGFATAARQGWLKAQLALMQHYLHVDGTLGRRERDTVGEAFDKILVQSSSQHEAPPVSSLGDEALESLELFDSSGFYTCVALMLERALRRGYTTLAQRFIGHRDASDKCKYVVVCAKRRNVVLLRWMLENGTPIDTNSAIEVGADRNSVAHVEVASYLSEGDCVQLVCQAIAYQKCHKMVQWTLTNTSFIDESSRTTIRNAIKQDSNDIVPWLRENLTDTAARAWCV